MTPLTPAEREAREIVSDWANTTAAFLQRNPEDYYNPAWWRERLGQIAAAAAAALAARDARIAVLEDTVSRLTNQLMDAVAGLPPAVPQPEGEEG